MNEKPARKSRCVLIDPEALHRARVEALCSKKVSRRFGMAPHMTNLDKFIKGLNCRRVLSSRAKSISRESKKWRAESLKADSITARSAQQDGGQHAANKP